MKKKASVLLSLSFLSVALIACGTDEEVNSPPANAQEEVQEEVQEETTDEMIEKNQDEEQKLEEENSRQEEKIRFVTQSINDLHDFDNESYDERNQKLLDNFTQERANEISNFETLDSAIDFVSTIDIDYIYQDIADENRFIVEAEMSFQVEDNEATIFRNVVILTIDEQNNEYRITEMETVPVPRPSMVP